MKFIKISLFSMLALSLFVIPMGSASAQNKSIDVSYTFAIADNQAVDGDILSTKSDGIVREDAGFSSKIFGVLQDRPLIVYKSFENDNTKAVARSGIADVNVTNINGNIKNGDYITSSIVPGKGQKADKSGYVIGVALQPFNGEGDQKVNFQGRDLSVGKIQVAVRIEYAEINTTRSILRLLEYFNAALFQNLQNPERFVIIIRYISAGMVLIVSFIIGFLTFSRSIPKAIEAIGRNPLARRSIQFSLVLNIVFTVAIALVGVMAAFVILRV